MNTLGRRSFITRSASAACALALASCGTSTPRQARLPRMGLFQNFDPPDPAVRPLLDAFSDGLKELGYEEGKTLIVERRYTNGDDRRFDDIAAEFARMPVDVIVGASAPATRAAKRATSSIPIVMLLGSDPVEAGLVQSLSQPGGNVTGMGVLTTVTAAKRIELLKEAFPSLRRVAVITQIRDGDPTGALQLRAAQDAARALQVETVPIELRDPSAELGRALDIATAQQADALMTVSVPQQVSALRKEIVAYATARRIPSAYPAVGGFVEEGGLLAFSESGVDTFRRAAGFVARILKGATPADLPIEQPTTFDLVVNAKTANSLGLSIAPSVLSRATKVIQ